MRYVDWFSCMFLSFSFAYDALLKCLDNSISLPPFLSIYSLAAVVYPERKIKIIGFSVFAGGKYKWNFARWDTVFVSRFFSNSVRLVMKWLTRTSMRIQENLALTRPPSNLGPLPCSPILNFIPANVVVNAIKDHHPVNIQQQVRLWDWEIAWSHLIVHAIYATRHKDVCWDVSGPQRWYHI